MNELLQRGKRETNRNDYEKVDMQVAYDFGRGASFDADSRAQLTSRPGMICKSLTRKWRAQEANPCAVITPEL